MDQEVELYNLINDAEEFNNLTGYPKSRKVLNQMKSLMEIAIEKDEFTSE